MWLQSEVSLHFGQVLSLQHSQECVLQICCMYFALTYFDHILHISWEFSARRKFDGHIIHMCTLHTWETKACMCQLLVHAAHTHGDMLLHIITCVAAEQDATIKTKWHLVSRIMNKIEGQMVMIKR